VLLNGEFLSEIHRKCEGMCRIRDIKMIITLLIEVYRRSKSKKITALGDEIYVKLKCDLVKKQLDFNF
jgi:hypothetical protein